MENLKKYWPFSFRGEDVASMIVSIVIYVVIGIVSGVVCAVIGIAPLIGDLISWLGGSLVGVYPLVGIGLAVLNFLKIK